MSDDFYIVFEPLSSWPQPDTAPRSSPRFQASYDATLKKLREELRMLDVSGAVVIQVVTRNGRTDLRRDGMLMSRAQVVHPGVRVSFDSRHGPLTYASDAYESTYYNATPDWQHNLRAVALGLEALRAVDRYGISGSGEQYRGWQQIAARTSNSSGMSREVAMSVLVEESGLTEGTIEELLRAGRTQSVVRPAVKAAHPDHNNGDGRRWNALTEAMKALGVSE